MSQICSKNVFKIYSWPAGGSIAWGGAGGAVWSCFCPGGGGLGLAYSAKITHPSRNCIQKEEMWEDEDRYSKKRKTKRTTGKLATFDEQRSQ